MMERSINKLDDTLHEIIEYSRNARQEILVEQIDFDSMISDNIERLAFMPGAESIRKEVIVHSEFPFYSDSYRLSVIFNNLISNAIKYSDPRKTEQFIKINVLVSPEKAYLRFEDNGIGIQPEYVEKVFEMFFRATVQKDGAGLGLYIVKEAVEKLNGEIKVLSEAGKGTVFIMEIKNQFFPNESGD
jgi:signal transduction histidine kinase